MYTQYTKTFCSLKYPFYFLLKLSMERKLVMKIMKQWIKKKKKIDRNIFFVYHGQPCLWGTIHHFVASLSPFPLRYEEHLSSKVRVILLTEDVRNRELANESGILTCSIEAYINQLGNSEVSHKETEVQLRYLLNVLL